MPRFCCGQTGQIPPLSSLYAFSRKGTKSATTPIRTSRSATFPLTRNGAKSLSVQELLRKLGVHSRYIRPPYGNFDANTVAIAKAEGADIMLWSIDSMDWSKRASIENMKTLISGQKLRGVFLFHDTHEQTIEALPEILDRLIADGCQFVTVSEYLAALRQDALPEGVNVAAPRDSGEPASAGSPQGTQAEREAPQQLFQPGDVHEVRQPMALEAEGGGNPRAEQMAGHSTNMNDAEPAALRTSML